MSSPLIDKSADFIAKLKIALKECSESEYWLELLTGSGYYDDATTLEQCIEVKKLLNYKTLRVPMGSAGFIIDALTPQKNFTIPPNR